MPSEILSQFTAQGFRIVDDASVAKAVSDLGINLSDEEQRREPIFKVDQALEADLVILVYARLVAPFQPSSPTLVGRPAAPSRAGAPSPLRRKV